MAKQSTKPNQSLSRTVVVLAVMLVSSLLVGGVAYKGYQGDVLHVRAAPQPITELYFSKPQDLPEHWELGRTYQLPFTIVNHEGRPAPYNVQVTIREGDQIRHLPTETFSLADGEIFTKEIVYSPDQPKTSTSITVNILNKDQVIHFATETL